jgi:hypothetical protein
LGAPPLCGGGPPYTLGHSASVPVRPDGLRPGSAGPALWRTFQSCLALGSRLMPQLSKQHLQIKLPTLAGRFPSPSLCRRGGAGGEVTGKAETPGHPIAISAVPKAICQSRARLHSPFRTALCFSQPRSGVPMRLRCEGLTARFVKQNALPQTFAGRGMGADHLAPS